MPQIEPRTEGELLPDGRVMWIENEVYSRVVGFLRPAQVGKRPVWNKGKFQEWQERKTYIPKTPEQRAVPRGT